jgi:hypothetical protein
MQPLWLQETAKPRADTFVQHHHCRHAKVRSLHLLMLCTKPMSSSLTLCLDACLCGGGYLQYLLNKATELNDCNKTSKSKYYPLYENILCYWFPVTEGYDVCSQWRNIPGTLKRPDYTVTFVIKRCWQPLLLDLDKQQWLLTTLNKKGNCVIKSFQNAGNGPLETNIIAFSLKEPIM